MVKMFALVTENGRRLWWSDTRADALTKQEAASDEKIEAIYLVQPTEAEYDRSLGESRN